MQEDIIICSSDDITPRTVAAVGSRAQLFTAIHCAPAFVQRQLLSWLCCYKVTVLRPHFLLAAGFTWPPVFSKGNEICCLIDDLSMLPYVISFLVC